MKNKPDDTITVTLKEHKPQDMISLTLSAPPNSDILTNAVLNALGYPSRDPVTHELGEPLITRSKTP